MPRRFHQNRYQVPNGLLSLERELHRQWERRQQGDEQQATQRRYEQLRAQLTGASNAEH